MSLLSEMPDNSTAWELAMAEAMALPIEIENAVAAMHGLKQDHPTPAFLPPLIMEYGLTVLTPYILDAYTLVKEGPAWTRIRSSDGAVMVGLSWLGLAAEIEKARPWRHFWNQNTLVFSTLPEVDDPLLEQVEGVTRLSMALRSDLWRGVFGYDVRALEADGTRLDHSILDVSSGIRLKDDGAIWSFGRTWEVDCVVDETAGDALGIWIDAPEDEGGGLSWDDAQIPWTEANFPWVSDAAELRSAVMMHQLAGLEYLVAFFDDEGEPIGFRRPRAVRRVSGQIGGCYQFAGIGYEPDETGGALYIEAMTAFDDAHLVNAAHVALTANPTIAEGVLPGLMWLDPGLVSGGVEIVRRAFDIPMRKTVREQVKLMVRV